MNEMAEYLQILRSIFEKHYYHFSQIPLAFNDWPLMSCVRSNHLADTFLLTLVLTSDECCRPPGELNVFKQKNSFRNRSLQASYQDAEAFGYLGTALTSEAEAPVHMATAWKKLLQIIHEEALKDYKKAQKVYKKETGWESQLKSNL